MFLKFKAKSSRIPINFPRQDFHPPHNAKIYEYLISCLDNFPDTKSYTQSIFHGASPSAMLLDLAVSGIFSVVRLSKFSPEILYALKILKIEAHKLL